jgi:hypothetical protein
MRFFIGIKNDRLEKKGIFHGNLLLIQGLQAGTEISAKAGY